MPEHLSKKLISWASILEGKTRAQAEMTATMPFIWPHMALMPDAHLGKGATVGSVIPTVGAIIPAAVGVDIGCVDAESEYLSPAGWRKISEYDGGPVMQYEPEGKSGSFVQPLAFIVKPCESFYRLKTKYGVDQMLSPDHRVLFWKIEGRNRRRVQAVMSATDFVAEHGRLKQGIKGEFATTFIPLLDSKLELSDEQIRVQVMVNADAHLERGRTAAVRLKKNRKILRARELLTAAGIPWTERHDADATTTFRFAPPLATKSYGQFWQASAEQLWVVAEECLNWDGNKAERCFYTRDRESADFIQYAFTATGCRAVLRAGEHYRDGRTDYRVFLHPNTMIGVAGSPKTPIETVPSEDGLAYCFTVPSGFWVMRRGGNVVMTGNCGMMAVRTQWTVAKLREAGQLATLREDIEKRVPSSAGRYNQSLYSGNTRVRVESLERMPGALSAKSLAPAWPLQLGSLGGGNHFIEISADEDDNVWAFLHSGSRGVGNKLANSWIKVAQEQCAKWHIKLPDKDLAYLVEDTPEFAGYIRDLRWAQNFAYLNRKEMMDRVLDCLEEFMGRPVEKQQQVNCHHNYTMRERHFGKEVWLSRKGAIDASKGVFGLIPGSMGTRSYVVEGKGNRLALNSSPHGAGRVYSRAAARKQFTRAELDKAMEGIEWGQRDAFLDEIPAAYKDIDQVMKDAADLVEVKHELRQLINVKGE